MILIILLATNCLLVFAILIWAMQQPHRLILFPPLAAAVYAGWLLPQAFAVSEMSYIPEFGRLATFVMMNTSLICVCLGWRVATRRPIYRLRISTYSRHRILAGIFILTIIGGFFSLKLRALPTELLEEGIWSGPTVAYKFFADLQYYAFIMAILYFFRYRSRAGIALALVNFLFFADIVFLGARRQQMVELILITFSALWLCRRYEPSRLLWIIALITAPLIINSIGYIRAVTVPLLYGKEAITLESFSKLGEIDFLGNVLGDKYQRSIELEHGAVLISGVIRKGAYDFGMEYWNLLIFRYVPAQLIGAEQKNSLMAFESDHEESYLYYGFVPNSGLTFTGFKDAFQSFWFLGAMVFFAISYLLGRLYVLGLQGDFWCQFLYLTLLGRGLLSLTHNSTDFWISILHTLIFVGTIFWASRTNLQTHQAPSPETHFGGEAVRAR